MIKNDGPDAKSKPSPIDVHVGARIRRCRKMLAITQEELGDALDVAFQQIQKYERGTNRIGASRLYALCLFFKVSPNYFFEGLPNCAATLLLSHERDLDGPNSNAAAFQSDESELLEAFAKITSADIRRRLAELVKSLSDTSI